MRSFFNIIRRNNKRFNRSLNKKPHLELKSRFPRVFSNNIQQISQFCLKISISHSNIHFIFLLAFHYLHEFSLLNLFYFSIIPKTQQKIQSPAQTCTFSPLFHFFSIFPRFSLNFSIAQPTYFFISCSEFFVVHVFANCFFLPVYISLICCFFGLFFY